MESIQQNVTSPKLNHEHLETFQGALPPDRSGRISSSAGQLVRFANGAHYEFAAYWDCTPGSPCRGNHYHNMKTEVMYVISGRLHAAYYDLDSDERLDRVLVAGDLVTIQPRLVHSYVAIDDTQVVEVASHAYDPADTHQHVLL